MACGAEVGVGVTGAVVGGVGAGGVEVVGAVDSVRVGSAEGGASGAEDRLADSQVEGRLADSRLAVVGSCEGMMAVALVVVHRDPWVDARRDHVVAAHKGRAVAVHRGRVVAARRGRAAAAHRDPAVAHRDPVRMGPEQPRRDQPPRRTAAGSPAASPDSQVDMTLAGSLVDSHGKDTSSAVNHALQPGNSARPRLLLL